MLGSAGRAQRLWQGKHRVMSQLSLVHPTPGTCDTLLPPPCWPHCFSMGIWRAPGLGFLGGPGHLLVLASSWVVRQPRRATASPGPRRSSPIWWPHPAGSPLRSPLSGQPGPCPQGTVGRAGRAQHHQHVPHSPSTHLSWAEDGLGEELDEVGGRTVSSSSLTASLRVPTAVPCNDRGDSHGSRALHGGHLMLPWSHPPVPSACTHPWSLVVLGKGRSWKQPLVGPGQRVSKKNSTWGAESGWGDTCQSPVLHLPWGTAQGMQGLHVALPH